MYGFGKYAQTKFPLKVFKFYKAPCVVGWKLNPKSWQHTGTIFEIGCGYQKSFAKDISWLFKNFYENKCTFVVICHAV